MVTTLDCSFWNPNLDFSDKLEYTYEKISDEYELKKPILTILILKKILQETKDARKRYLLTLDLPTIFDKIGQITDLWMNPNYHGRKLARKVLPIVTGFSEEMIEKWGFKRFMKILAKDNLPLMGTVQPHDFQTFHEYHDGLLRGYGTQEITHSNYEPEIVGHICAGNIMGIAAFEMILDKLIDAASWIKVPSEEPVFGAMYARSIEETDPELAYTIAVLPFESGNEKIKDYLISQSDIIRATGGEEARIDLTKISEKHNVPISGHWHKFSFITIAREYLTTKRARDIAELVSLDVTAWDQQGCFSPQEIFVENGGEINPEKFAGLIAEEMEHTAQAIPKGTNSGRFQILNGYHKYFKKQMMGQPIKIFQSPSNKWLVVYDASTPIFEPSPLFRVIRVKPVADLMEIVNIVKPLGRFLQTVGVAISDQRLLPFADALGEIGATNIRPVSSMTIQKPWEPWDGRFPLQELFVHDNIHWVSISTKKIDEELDHLLEQKRVIVKK